MEEQTQSPLRGKIGGKSRIRGCGLAFGSTVGVEIGESVIVLGILGTSTTDLCTGL